MILKIDGVRDAVSYGFDRARESDLVHQVDEFRRRPAQLSGGAIARAVAGALLVSAFSIVGAYRAGKHAVQTEFAGRVETLQSVTTLEDQKHAKAVREDLDRMRLIVSDHETKALSRDVEIADLIKRIRNAKPVATAMCGTPKKIVQALNK
jgi:uncharacterized protein YabE (DUF348 family)